jgi:chemotaxis protein histidine kinase CheA
MCKIVVTVKMTEEEVEMVFESLDFLTSKIKKIETYEKLADDFLKISQMVKERKEEEEKMASDKKEEPNPKKEYINKITG